MRMVVARLAAYLSLAVGACLAQQTVAPDSPPPEFGALDQAYKELRDRHFDTAIAAFRTAAQIAPRRADIQKELGYALIKTGDSAAARDAFARAMALDPADTQLALEFAFLANDTGQQREARRVFDHYRGQGNQTAAQAFANIDAPLRDGIARWSAIVERDPSNFSAQEELAKLAELRDEGELAIEHYRAAWKLRPDHRELLVVIGRLLGEAGRFDESIAALLAASRGGTPRTAEMARDLLPGRYPYVYEFRRALTLDPGNTALRGELGYLLIAMGDSASGQQELDLAKPARSGFSTRDASNSTAIVADARTMGFRSFEAGYFPDAIRYLTQAIDDDPLDFEAMLKLAWAYNITKQDDKALPLFGMAAKSPDAETSSEAARAIRNLTLESNPPRASVWMFPTFSTRWHSAFGYAQVRSDLRLPLPRPLHAYASTRFVGDSRGAIQQPGFAASQYLSETSVIPGIGITTETWKGARLWAEAGTAWSYLPKPNAGRAVADYRGGISFNVAKGTLIGATSPGVFFEHGIDALYVHRFGKTFLMNLRNRFGVTLPASALRLQLTWNANWNADPKRQYWANFVETGPGVRFRFTWMPPSMLLSVDALRGVYTINRDNPRRPNFNDVRVGVWYSFSR
jgi:Tfp pilus assembly protein PilF